MQVPEEAIERVSIPGPGDTGVCEFLMQQLGTELESLQESRPGLELLSPSPQSSRYFPINTDSSVLDYPTYNVSQADWTRSISDSRICTYNGLF